MRRELRRRAGVRLAYRGTFIRFGTRPVSGGHIGTVLLSNVTDELNQWISDHVWLPDDRAFRGSLRLRCGDRVWFMAYVEKYNGGRQYGLQGAVMVRKIERIE